MFNFPRRKNKSRPYVSDSSYCITVVAVLHLCFEIGTAVINRRMHFQQKAFVGGYMENARTINRFPILAVQFIIQLSSENLHFLLL